MAMHCTDFSDRGNKTEIFQLKIVDTFLIFATNII